MGKAYAHVAEIFQGYRKAKSTLQHGKHGFGFNSFSCGCKTWIPEAEEASRHWSGKFYYA